jgi:hypothetical protein
MNGPVGTVSKLQNLNFPTGAFLPMKDIEMYIQIVPVVSLNNRRLALEITRTILAPMYIDRTEYTGRCMHFAHITHGHWFYVRKYHRFEMVAVVQFLDVQLKIQW